MNYILIIHDTGYWISITGKGTYQSDNNHIDDGHCKVRILSHKSDGGKIAITTSGNHLVVSSHRNCISTPCPCRKLAFDFCSYISSGDDFETFLTSQSGRLAKMTNFDYILYDGSLFYSISKQHLGVNTITSYLNPGIYHRRY
jgi:hypothetical protein